MNPLNTHNREHITWSYEEADFALMGGLRLDQLDRMRVTLKVQFKIEILRHTVDPYNDTQVDSLVKKCAEKFGLTTTYLKKSTTELTNQLESWRLEENERLTTPQDKNIHISEEDVRAAQAFLKKPDLLKRTNDLIGKSGVIGEEKNRLLMYLIFTSRKRSHPLHIVSLASSGMGKSHLQDKVGELIPEEDKIEITTLSANAFYYFGQQELQNKLILIEDLDGADAVLYPLRELQSKKKISKTVVVKNNKGNARSINLVVEGPVSVSGATTQEKIYEDNANRSFLIYLDESQEQDQAIMDYQRKASAGNINFEEETNIQELLKNTQRVLDPVTVVNPYAEELVLPKEVFKARRTNNHYLQFIEAVTFYHQKQREEKADENGESHIETTLEDIELANELMKDVLLRKSDALSGACRKYLEDIKSYLINRNRTNSQSGSDKPSPEFTNREIRNALRVNASNQKRYNAQLFEDYHLQKVKGKVGTAHTLLLTSPEEYQRLQNQINNVLDENLAQLKKRFTGSKQSTKRNEPVKVKKAS